MAKHQSNSKLHFSRQTYWLPALLVVLLIAGLALIFHASTDELGGVADPAANPDTGVIETALSIAAAPQRKGDAQKGEYHLLNSPYVSCGLPLRVAEKLGSLDAAPALPGRQGAGRELPYYNNLVTDGNGQRLLATNCLLCHAAPLFDEIVVGLGNEFLDFTDNPSRTLELAGTLISGPAETQAWQKLADRVAVVAPYIQPSTVGANVANNLTFALMAHRDPTSLRWSDTALIRPPDEEVLPVSVPPWWRMAKKNAMFYQAQMRGDHARFMMTAAILCAEDRQEIEQTDHYAADLRAYIASLEPPAYPFTINTDLAMRGRAVFQSNCAPCHGNYEQPESYPNLLIPLDVIGTDPALARQAAIDYRRFVDWSERSYFGEHTQFVPLQGYVPPPLDGVWATAPFLHNGSVPTLAALLDSSQRPAYWRHTEERDYDQVNLGWAFIRLDSGKNASRTAAENKWIYDTEQRGYGNQGHLFGDALSTAQRQAILEYLKTL